MSKTQKQAVIDEVLNILPGFVKFRDNAISMLSTPHLEIIKQRVAVGIASGAVDYSKDVADLTEVKSYARSMTMNHLKKAKELNGNSTPDSKPAVQTKAKNPYGIDVNLLPDELKEFVKTL